MNENLKVFNFHNFDLPQAHFFLALAIPALDVDFQNLEIIICQKKQDRGGFMTIEEVLPQMPPIQVIDDYLKKFVTPCNSVLKLRNGACPQLN